jgi:serine/threonine protein kinase
MTRNTVDPPATIGPDDDSALVDEVFDLALTAVERGEGFDLEAFSQGREHLHARLEEAVRLAREIAVNAPRSSEVREVAGYEIEHELGAGSMGTVYLARQRSLGGRRVALKVLPPSLGLSDRSKARFLSEARALGNLDHPGIVGVHDVVDCDGIVAYAMEWIPAGSLARVLQAWRAHPEHDEMETLASCLGIERSELTATNATTWLLRAFRNLLRALSVVHAKGLLHRDIKPANLLVASDGRLLLSDFGLVHDDDSSVLTRTGQFIGTLAYSSPEQLRGDHDAIDVRSDLYSLGITLYEALTLRRPYEASTLPEIQRRAESGVFDPPRRNGARLPRDLETILGKAIDPDPAQRYGSADEFADDIDRLLAFRPILARPASRWQRLSKAVRRNRRLLVAANVGATVAIVSSAAIAWYLWRTPRELAAMRLKAELALVDTSRYESLLAPENAIDKAAVLTSRLDASWSSTLGEALAIYDRALNQDPFRLFDAHKALRFERDIVELTRAVGSKQADSSSILERLEPSLPLTVHVARRWSGPSSTGPLSQAELTAASERDRYALGMFGFLLYDTQLAVKGWSSRPIDAEPDALSDGALGEIYLTDERPALAYPHLQNAFRLAKQSKYLCCELADCAVRLNDLPRAEELLERAEHIPTQDTYELAARVRADLLAKCGDLAGARARYADLLTRHSGPRLLGNYANLVREMGDIALEVHLRLAIATQSPNLARRQQELLDAAERWWWSVGRERRWSVVQKLIDGDVSQLPQAIHVRPRLLEALQECRAQYESLPATRRWDIPAPRVWQPPRFGPSAERVVPSLLELTDDLVFCGASRDTLHSLTPAFKDALATLWVSPIRQPYRAAFAGALIRAGQPTRNR